MWMPNTSQKMSFYLHWPNHRPYWIKTILIQYRHRSSMFCTGQMDRLNFKNKIKNLRHPYWLGPIRTIKKIHLTHKKQRIQTTNRKSHKSNNHPNHIIFLKRNQIKTYSINLKHRKSLFFRDQNYFKNILITI
jgi:hypothetical protein